ncbi:MAG: UPF0280 family protein [Bacteroidota bacterium]|nr:UPF0280 family protein [Bacteroidota bacterium]
MGNTRWRSFRIEHFETDLWIAVDEGLYSKRTEKFSRERVIHYREILDSLIEEFPEFLTSLVPLTAPAGVHPLIGDMYRATSISGTGPMSAVAGAIAEYVCKDLVSEFGFTEVIVENGGDIFMRVTSPVTIAVYAGSSPLSDRIGVIIKPEDSPLSVCCSSGTIGHSLSFGTADACMIACRSGAQADAYATACCNEVKDASMIDKITSDYLQKPEILSVVIIKGDKVSVGGKLEVKILNA